MKKNKTKVQQQYKEEVDINNIVARYQNGQMPIGNSRQPMFADISNVGTLHEHLNNTKRIEAGFLNLPAQVRKKFHNDPHKLLDFLENDENYQEAVDMGLVPPIDDSSLEDEISKKIDKIVENTTKSSPEHDKTKEAPRPEPE